MKLETGNRNQTVVAGIVGVLAIIAAIYIYESLFATSIPSTEPASVTMAARQAPAAAHTAKVVTGPANSLDPSLHMKAMLASEAVQYSGVGRNIFSPYSAPPVQIPQPVAPVRTKQAPPVPCPPNCPPPPPPPPIELKYFGVEIGANGKRQACLLHGDTVYLATDGDVVMRRYKIITVDPKSIQVEDMQTNNRQTLPLLTN